MIQARTRPTLGLLRALESDVLEQSDGHGRGVAELETTEGHVVDVVLQDAGRVDGTALGGHRDGVEDLEGADYRHDEDERQDRTQQRHRDPPEHGPLAGAVDLARLVNGARDRLEAGEDEKGCVTHVPPHVDQRDRGDGQG